MPTDDEFLARLRERLNELNNKSTQVLIFLSFAIAAGALLWTKTPPENGLTRWALFAMICWVLAIFPTVLGILPVQDRWLFKPRCLDKIRWGKVIALWLAVALIFGGAVCFLIALL